MTGEKQEDDQEKKGQKSGKSLFLLVDSAPPFSLVKNIIPIEKIIILCSNSQ